MIWANRGSSPLFKLMSRNGMLRSIPYHWKRLRFELGRPLVLGSKKYRVRGFLPNRLTTSDRHEAHLLVPFAHALRSTTGHFVDVGVNTGQTLQKVLTIDPGRSYVGFEPQVGCCYFVDQFIRDNRAASAQVVPLALSDRNALLPIYSAHQFDEMASLVETSHARHARLRTATFVSARIGDEVLSEMGIARIGVLKVDVEGAELSVFRGLRGTIDRDHPICFFEVLPNFVGQERTLIDQASADRNRADAAEIFEFFVSAGYAIFQIDKSGGIALIIKFDLDRPEAFVSRDYMAKPAN